MNRDETATKLVEPDEKNIQPPVNMNTYREPNVWYLLKWMIFIGMGAILIVSWSAFWKMNEPDDFSRIIVSLGTSLLISLACFSSGGLLGFLFAVPKILQNDVIVDGENKIKRSAVLHNDNLVQISDWITKIIVGVGLTQLYNIPGYVSRIGQKLSWSFGFGEVGSNIGIGYFIYFTVIGFLSVYIWTRIYFIGLLSKVNRNLEQENAALEQQKEQVQKQKDKLDAHNKQAADKEEDKVKESIGFIPVLGPVTNPDDPQKGRFGGKPEVNGRKLNAIVKETALVSFFDVAIWVESTDLKKPLDSTVVFYLHDSFRPSVFEIPPEKFKEGKAVDDEIKAWGAFTVGAVTDNGQTLLELDLAELPDAPKLFKER